MTIKDSFAADRSLNGNHTPACALPTRGGVCDCWPTSDSAPWRLAGGSAAGEPSQETIFNGLGTARPSTATPSVTGIPVGRTGIRVRFGADPAALAEAVDGNSDDD